MYGDQAYAIPPWMKSAHRTALATDEQLSFNTSMSVVRIAAEWNYKDVKQ